MDIERTEKRIKEMKREAHQVERDNPPEARKLYLRIFELEQSLAYEKRKRKQQVLEDEFS